MELLKLAALDPEDLAVLSAHLQDAVLRAGDLAWLPGARRFALVARRLDRSGEPPQRRLVGVHFERVMGVKARGLPPGVAASGGAPGTGGADATLSLLAITFEPGEPPSGTATLVFAGEAAIRLDLECVEARMKDLGPVWAAEAQPDHALDAAVGRAVLRGGV